MATHLNITGLTHEKLRKAVPPASCAIDATAGNGHDAVFIAELLGEDGELHLIDCQERALESTRRRFTGLANRPTLCYHLGNHASVLEALEPRLSGKVTACVFNLGYLPGGDKTITTQRPDTLQALTAADFLLKAGGILSIVCYPGHPAGTEEAAAVSEWAQEQKDAGRYDVEVYRNFGTKRPGPYLIWLQQKV